MKPFLPDNEREWEDLATLDPLWSILSEPSKRFSKWNVEEFFATGAKEVSELLVDAASLGCLVSKDRALDFGCGAGRVTRVLADHFQKCWGVDISRTMIGLAERFNRDRSNCNFVVSTPNYLGVFPSNHFDLIYSNHVLQHIPQRTRIESYIREFVRLLTYGGLLVFQLASWVPLKNRIQPRRKLYLLLRAFGVSPRFLYANFHLYPMRMNFMTEDRVVAIVESSGAKVLRIRRTGGDRMGQSSVYFVSK